MIKITKKLTRRYVYQDMYDEIIRWSKKRPSLPRSPNGKENFCFLLEKYIQELKQNAKITEKNLS